MKQPHHGADDVAFSAYSADTEDYFNFLSSDESMSEEDAPAPLETAENRDPVEELASAFASSSSIGSSCNVFTPIGSLNGRNSMHKEAKRLRQEVAAPASGVFHLGGIEKLKVSARALELHQARKTQLQQALDAATDSTTGGQVSGEAPFRFMMQCKKVVKFEDEMDVSGASSAPVVERVEGHAPEKKALGRRRSIADESEDSEEEIVEPDPLYDEQLDNVDEQWVETNLRGDRGAKPETDATLCCPCCFVTVCMVCERHATFTNQYRASAAINCRVKKDEILTYTSEGSRVPASLPFHKRQNLAASDNRTSATTAGQQIARLLQEDEFYPVACSDCGTVVGVYDRSQQYHFFNALPSNC